MNKPTSGSASVWGSEETRLFFELTPEKILGAVEEFGLRCTGRYLALNSMENRVIEVEIEGNSDTREFRVAKYYRPGRWSKEQIAEEHEFLAQLAANDVPVVPPIQAPDGGTISKVPGAEIFVALFPKVGGRLIDELRDDQVDQIGRMLARLHAIGASTEAKHRLSLTPENFGEANLNLLLEAKVVPPQLEQRYSDLVNELVQIVSPWFKECRSHRIHGDCHLGNILWGRDSALMVDFDDMLVGPAIQDLWLILPSRDAHSRAKFQRLIEAYGAFRDFDFAELRLIEALRALRYVHFSAWISRRWDDPSFKKVFVDFENESFWSEQISDLAIQLQHIREVSAGKNPLFVDEEG